LLYRASPYYKHTKYKNAHKKQWIENSMILIKYTILYHKRVLLV